MTENFLPLELIPLFPALGTLFNLFLGQRAGRRAVNLVAPAALFLSFAIALWAFARIVAMPPGGALTGTLWPWIAAGAFHTEIALRLPAHSSAHTSVLTR